jgi:flavodoxin
MSYQKNNATHRSMSRRGFLSGSALLAASIVLSACGSSTPLSSSASSSSSASTTSSTAGTSSSASSSEPNAATGNGKTLVAYYSAQGHTKAVAEVIANALGADVFVIEPAKPYSEEDLNWRDQSSRVCAEHDNPSLIDNTLTVNAPVNFADYDTVYVGFPIWWQGPSWAMTAFASSNDFAGKTVVPFCTSTSSGIGNSGTELANLAGTGNWQEGKRFPERASNDEVEAWIAGPQA